jgi:hypothetical protein
MWIVIAGLALTSPLIAYYLINNSSAIVIDKKKSRVIVLDKTPPTVINLSDLIGVDLIINGLKTKTQDGKQEKIFVKNISSIQLKIFCSNNEPVYLPLLTNKKKVDFKAIKRAITLHNKLAELSSTNLQTENINRKSAIEFQLKNLTEFRTNMARQAAS